MLIIIVLIQWKSNSTGPGNKVLIFEGALNDWKEFACGTGKFACENLSASVVRVRIKEICVRKSCCSCGSRTNWGSSRTKTPRHMGSRTNQGSSLSKITPLLRFAYESEKFACENTRPRRYTRKKRPAPNSPLNKKTAPGRRFKMPDQSVSSSGFSVSYSVI